MFAGKEGAKAAGFAGEYAASGKTQPPAQGPSQPHVPAHFRWPDGLGKAAGPFASTSRGPSLLRHNLRFYSHLRKGGGGCRRIERERPRVRFFPRSPGTRIKPHFTRNMSVAFPGTTWLYSPYRASCQGGEAFISRDGEARNLICWWSSSTALRDEGALSPNAFM